jgi:hypothetical protein
LNTKLHRQIKVRLKAPAGNLPGFCAIPDCGRQTMASLGVGLAVMHCQYHIQFRARHGSHWYPTYKAADLKPYLASAAQHIKQRSTEPYIAHSLMALRALLDGAGRTQRAQDIKWKKAPARARIAFARLREADIEPERLLAIHVAVSALILDDNGSHRVPEYRIVQVAKAAHRLASGSHGSWTQRVTSATTRPIPLHVYPKSSGQVLRVMGKAIEECCELATERELQAARDLKRERFGPHPSQLPGWKPLWMRKREQAMAAAGKAK